MKNIALNPASNIAAANLELGQPATPPPNTLRPKASRTWKRRTVVLGLGLALMLPLSLSALDYLVPKSLMPGQSAFTRAGWYLRSGQWKADVRTFVSAVKYVMDSDVETPTASTPPTKQLTAPSKPVSTHGAGA